MSFDPRSRARLTPRDLGRFPSESLFDRLGRAVAAAGCLPRRELYEAWEVARRVRRVYRGGRVIDFAGGHGLLASILLVLDDSSPGAVVVETVVPASAARVHAALVDVWPRLASRVSFLGDLGRIEVSAHDLVVSCHACGDLTDRALALAASARARVAVLPCCHDLGRADTGGLDGWLEPTLAVDVMRANRLREQGYRVRTQTIPATITPKNRLLLGEPVEGEVP